MNVLIIANRWMEVELIMYVAQISLVFSPEIAGRYRNAINIIETIRPVVQMITQELKIKD